MLFGVELAWTVRDIRAEGLHDTLWSWPGLNDVGSQDGILATGALDLVLLLVLAGVLIAARRPTVTWGYATAGLFVLVHRLPGLWIFTADWTEGAPMRGRALATAILGVAGGAALVLVALVERRRAGAVGGPGFGGAGLGGATGAGAGVGAPGPDAAGAGTGSGAEGGPAAGGGSPARPALGAAIAGGLLLVLVAVMFAGWQLFFVRKYDDPGYPPHLYRHLLTGELTLTTYLGVPAAYGAWAVAAFASGAAVAAFARAPLARPLGVATGLLLCVDSGFLLDDWRSRHLLFASDRVPDWELAYQGCAIVEAVAGLLVLVLLAQRARPRPVPFPGPAVGWGVAGGAPVWGAAPAGGTAAGRPSAWGAAPVWGAPPAAGAYGYPSAPSVPPAPGAAGAPGSGPTPPGTPLTPPTPASRPPQPTPLPPTPHKPPAPPAPPSLPAYPPFPASPESSPYQPPQQPGTEGGAFGPAPNLPPQLPLRPPPGTPPATPPGEPRDDG